MTPSFLALFGEDPYYQMLADAPATRRADADLWHIAFNPLLDMDQLLDHWEVGMLAISEFLEDAATITSDRLETIARAGKNTRSTMFKMFDGNFKSSGVSIIGEILREMHFEPEMKNWAPFLRRIRRGYREPIPSGDRRPANED